MVVLVPPLNFCLVAPRVYRSGHPNARNHAFLQKLGLKMIIFLSEEDYTQEMLDFCTRQHIELVHYRVEGNKEPFVEMDSKLVTEALRKILDKQNHPVLIHCDKGKHRVGCLVGCLRKLQKWSLASIYEEYRRFSGGKQRIADFEFIEMFDIAECA